MSSRRRAALRKRVSMFLTLSWPPILGFMSIAALPVIDMFLLGKVGEIEQAAYTTGKTLYILLVSFGLGFLYSINSFIAVSVGRKNRSICGSIAWQGVWFALIYGALICLIGEFSDQIFRIFDNEPEVFEKETLFFRTVIFSGFFHLIVIGLSNFFYGIERPKIPMSLSIIALIIHFIFAYNLIPSKGVTGAAYASIISSSAHAFLLLSCFLGIRSLEKFGTKKAKFSWQNFKTIASIGTPIGGRAVSETLVWDFAMIWLISQMGTAHIAATGILLYCTDLLMLPCDGFGTASITLIGLAIGSNKLKSANTWRRHTWFLVTVYCVIVGVFFYLFRQPIAAQFSENNIEVQNLVVSLSFFVPILLLFYGTYCAYDHALCATVDNRWPTIATFIISGFVFGVGGWLALTHFRDLKSVAVWTVFVVNVAAIGIAFFLRWEGDYWQKKEI